MRQKDGGLIWFLEWFVRTILRGKCSKTCPICNPPKHKLPRAKVRR